MTLRVSYLIAAFVALSLGSGSLVVNADDCTDDQETYITDEYYTNYNQVASVCEEAGDNCEASCQEEFESVLANTPDCTSFDGDNYYELMAAAFVCSGSASSTSTSEGGSSEVISCTTDEEETTDSLIASYSPDDCETTPCESSCYTLLSELAYALPSCDYNGLNYYEFYLGWYIGCEDVASTASSTSSGTDTTATATPETSSSGEASNSTTPSATSRATRTPTSGTTANDASASASGSASESNSAASVGSSAVGSLIAAGTLALLAVQA